MVKLALFFISFFVMRLAHAQTQQPVSCLPEVTSLQSYEVWNPEQASTIKTYALKSQRLGQISTTDVLVDLHYDGAKEALHLSFSFQNGELLSLPFNIYAVMVTSASGQSVWQDFTKSCVDPGIGFYPGQNVKLDPLPLKLRPHESYRVMIWGQK